MARIKIEDLPVLEELSKEEMADLFGGNGSGSGALPGSGAGDDGGIFGGDLAGGGSSTQGNAGGQGGAVGSF